MIEAINTTDGPNPNTDLERLGRSAFLLSQPNQKHAMSQKKPSQIDIHVGGRIRFRRMMLGISQEKLGERLGITFQQIQKYEKGTNRIGASRLQHIAIILKVPIAFFFEGQGTNGPPETSVLDLAGSSSESLKLFKKYSTLSPEGQKLLIKIAGVLEDTLPRHENVSYGPITSNQ